MFMFAIILIVLNNLNYLVSSEKYQLDLENGI